MTGTPGHTGSFASRWPRWLPGVVAFALTLVAFAPAVIAAERRVALVIGVGGYRHVPGLPNPPNDARDIAAALTRLGFDTETEIDPDRLKLEAATRRLGERARGADAAVFFFAGHALEAGGRNWLVPAPAEIKSDRDLRFETLELDSVLEQLDGTARLSILILDSCRDNPFRRRLQTGTRDVAAAGLGQVHAAAGTLVAFSTAPGTVADDGKGRNSPFTAALLKHIEKPGIEVRQMMAEVRKDVREATRGRQVPWENSALEGNFFFGALPVAAAPVTRPPATADPELLFWETVRVSREPADFRAYLARFPQGVFADLARNRLVTLESSVRPARSTPAMVPPVAIPAAAMDPATPEGREALLFNALSSVKPVPAGTLSGVVQAFRGYGATKRHKAFAVGPNLHIGWRAAELATEAQAEELVLEQCQLRAGEPCILFARNDMVIPRPSNGDWPRRDMERLRYSGPWRPERIPALTPARRREADIAGYGAAREPKAMAIHPTGRVFVVTRAAGQFAAEDQALRQCNADPVRAGISGPCFLYAIANRVVLPDRLVLPAAANPAGPPPAPVPPSASPPPVPGAPVAPVLGVATPKPVPSAAPSPAASISAVPVLPRPAVPATSPPVPSPPVASPPVASSSAPVPPAAAPPANAAPPAQGTAPPAPVATAPAREALLAQMVAAIPFAPSRSAEAMLRLYLSEPENRVFAVSPDRGETWRGGGFGSAVIAEQVVLERCQFRYLTPCVLFAINDAIQAPPAGTEWPRRDMPRVRAVGTVFDPDAIPMLSETRRRAPSIAGYAKAPEPKAMAIHPWGLVFVVSGATTQAEADAAALAACDNDPARGGRDGPCFLYASGLSVVLSERRLARSDNRAISPRR